MCCVDVVVEVKMRGAWPACLLLLLAAATAAQDTRHLAGQLDIGTDFQNVNILYETRSCS